MKYQEITNPLDNIPDKVPTFITEKWIEVHDQSGNLVNRCKPRKQITFETSMLQSDLCDYRDAYIVELLLLQEIIIGVEKIGL